MNTSTIDCFLWPETQLHGVVYIKIRDKKSSLVKLFWFIVTKIDNPSKNNRQERIKRAC